MRDLQLVYGETGERYAVELLACRHRDFERVFLIYEPSSTPRHDRDGTHGRCRAVRESATQPRFRRHYLRLEGDATAWGRAARLFRLLLPYSRRSRQS